MDMSTMVGKQAPRLGEGVRIVRQQNKRPTTRAGRAELKGKKRAFWGAMVMLPKTEGEVDAPPPEHDPYTVSAPAAWNDMTAIANGTAPPHPELADARYAAHVRRGSGGGAAFPPQSRIDPRAPGSATEAALALSMLSGAVHARGGAGPAPPRAPPRPGTHSVPMTDAKRPRTIPMPPGVPPQGSPPGAPQSAFRPVAPGPQGGYPVPPGATPHGLPHPRPTHPLMPPGPGGERPPPMGLTFAPVPQYVQRPQAPPPPGRAHGPWSNCAVEEIS